MYLKNNGIIVVSDINDVPLHEIRESQHLVLLEKKEVGYIDKEMIETTNSMVCNSIKNNILYVMECNRSYVLKDEHEESECSLEFDRFSRTYLKLNNELFNLGDNERRESYSIKELDQDNQRIYENIFAKNYLWFNNFNSEISESRIIYLPIELDQDTYLVFKISSSFTKICKWDIYYKTFIISRNSDEVIDLDVSFLNFYNKIKKIKKRGTTESCFKEFDEIIKLTHYDINKHVSLSIEEQEEMLNELVNIAQYSVSRNQLRELFSFFYSNGDIQIGVYSLKQYHPDFILYKDNKHISKYSYDEEMKIEMLKAKAIYNWDNSNLKNGIEPRSGQYYENGVISAHPKQYYEDAGGIIYNDNFRSETYYINIDDIFIRVDHKHKDAIQLKERKELSERLSI